MKLNGVGLPAVCNYAIKQSRGKYIIRLDADDIFDENGLKSFVFKINSFVINPGIRFDKNTISIDDRFLADGNSSDKINLNSLNPSLGINYKGNNINRFFVNVSTGFETPTLNEFGSSPIGSGFNKNLKSQNSVNYELGFSKNKEIRLPAVATRPAPEHIETLSNKMFNIL